MNLREYLDEVGISIEKFARRAGVSPVTIQNILHSKNDIRLSIAIRIEDATLDDRGKPKVTHREMIPKRLLNLKKEEKNKNREEKKKNKE